MRLGIQILIPFALTFTIAGCRMAPESHPINNNWTFEYYRLADGSLDSIADSLKTPDCHFSKSEEVDGSGPARNFKAETEIYTDGEIIIQNLWLSTSNQDSLSLLIDSIYFNRLIDANLFTIDGEVLTLTSDRTGIDMIYRK